MKKMTTLETLGAVTLIAALFSYICAMCAEAIAGTGLVLMVLSIIGYGILSAIQTSANASEKLQTAMGFAKIGFIAALLALSPVINGVVESAGV